jgi:hypothetical protein
VISDFSLQEKLAKNIYQFHSPFPLIGVNKHSIGRPILEKKIKINEWSSLKSETK